MANFSHAHCQPVISGWSGFHLAHDILSLHKERGISPISADDAKMTKRDKDDWWLSWSNSDLSLDERILAFVNTGIIYVTVHFLDALVDLYQQYLNFAIVQTLMVN